MSRPPGWRKDLLLHLQCTSRTTPRTLGAENSNIDRFVLRDRMPKKTEPEFTEATKESGVYLRTCVWAKTGGQRIFENAYRCSQSSRIPCSRECRRRQTRQSENSILSRCLSAHDAAPELQNPVFRSLGCIGRDLHNDDKTTRRTSPLNHLCSMVQTLLFFGEVAEKSG